MTALEIIGMVVLILIGLWVFVMGFALIQASSSAFGGLAGFIIGFVFILVAVGLWYWAWTLTPFEIVLAGRTNG